MGQFHNLNTVSMQVQSSGLQSNRGQQQKMKARETRSKNNHSVNVPR